MSEDLIDPDVEKIYKEWFYSGGAVSPDRGGLPDFREWARDKYPDIYKTKMIPLPDDEISI